MKQPSWRALLWKLGARAILNPRLAVDLLRLGWAFRARGWYRRYPFLPLPPSEYVAWRLYTAYGAERAVPPVEDVTRLARWRRKILEL